VVLVLAVLTFGSSLAYLVSHPALYGWNWTYALSSDDGYGAIPQQQLGSRLRGNADVAAWTTVSFLTADLDKQAVPVLLARPHAALSPPVLSGHPVDGKYQIVLGPATLAQLHKRLGDAVNVRFGNFISTRLTIVGTATMPVVGIAQGLHTSMGTGAVASGQLLGTVAGSCDGPQGMTFVRLRPGVSGASGAASMQRIANEVSKELATAPASNPCSGDSLTVLGVQHPAQIANWRAMDAAPESLAVGLAAGAIAALGLSLFASVRSRRRDLAVLKTIGFTRRQLAATVAWQASVAAITGIVVGVPLGIALGRSLWDLFARQIYAVPEPTIPAGAVILVAIGTLLLANLAAAVPGQSAARTPTALALRAE
jgi:hypothetical protein